MCAGVAGYTSKLLIKDEYPDWTMCELTIRTRTSSEDIDFESVVGFENRVWDGTGSCGGCELCIYIPALNGLHYYSTSRSLNDTPWPCFHMRTNYVHQLRSSSAKFVSHADDRLEFRPCHVCKTHQLQEN